jgi:hypothetical protein
MFDSLSENQLHPVNLVTVCWELTLYELSELTIAYKRWFDDQYAQSLKIDSSWLN